MIEIQMIFTKKTSNRDLKTTFSDRWGTEYPESIRQYVKPSDTVDLTRGMKRLALSVTKNAKTTDDAVMAIHAFVKNGLPPGKLPLLVQTPVMRASDVLGGGVGKHGMLSHNKAVAEVALLRSVDIPARIGTYACDLSPASGAILAKNAEKIADFFGWYPSLHNATEVYVKNEGEFKVKDASIPDVSCAELPGTCLADDTADWKSGHEIRGLMKHARCIKIADHGDYPGSLAVGIDIVSAIRNSTHAFDIIDPEG